MSLAACNGNPITEDITANPNNTGSASGIPSVGELIGDVAAVNKDIKSWRYSSSINMEMETVSEQGGHYKMSILNDGAVDLNANKIQSDMDISMDIFGEAIEMSMTTYLIDDSAYVRMGAPDGEEGQWVTQQLNTDQLEEVREMVMGSISSNTLVDWIEVVNFNEVIEDEASGVRCYLIEANPDINDVLDLTHDLMQGIDNSGELTTDVLNTFQNINIKFWIDQTDYFIIQSEISMLFSIENDDDQVTGDVELYTTLWDHNEDVIIQLPPEAI